MPIKVDVSRNVARALRRRMTKFERLLWVRLRNHRIGYHFRRQYQIGSLILDFYCHEARLSVELDGEGHERFHAAEDLIRDETLQELGIEPMRFKNARIGLHLENCLDMIRETCRRRIEESSPDREVD